MNFALSLGMFLDAVAIGLGLTAILSFLVILVKSKGKKGIGDDKLPSLEDQDFNEEEDDSEDDDEDQSDFFYEYGGEWLYYQWLVVHKAKGVTVKDWIELSDEAQDHWSAFFARIEPRLKSHDLLEE